MAFGFAGVGALMLALVLITYLRMVSARMKVRERGDHQDKLTVEQADTLVAFGREEDALRLLEKALQDRPESGPIRACLERVRLEIEEREGNA